MAIGSQVLDALRAEQQRLRNELSGVERAISALQSVPGITRTNSTRRTGVRRHLSAAARKRIADAQRARWAKVKGRKGGSPQSPSTIVRKRRISKAGIERIRAAAKKRWERFRAQKKK